MGAYTLPQNMVGNPAIAITFDDANGSTYNLAYQYMHYRSMPGTFYVRTALIGTSGRVQSDELLAMANDGWSICNHTRDHTDLTTLNQAQVQAELNNGKTDLQSLGITGNDPLHVAYPWGAYNATVLAAMAATGMLTGRTTAIGYPTLPFANAYTIEYSLYLSHGTTTLDQAKTWVDGVLANNRLGISLGHDLVESPSNSYEWGIADFRALIDYIVLKQVPIVTIDEVYRLQSGPVTVRTGEIPASWAWARSGEYNQRTLGRRRVPEWATG